MSNPLDCTCEDDAHHLEYLRLVAHPRTKQGWRNFMRALHMTDEQKRKVLQA